MPSFARELLGRSVVVLGVALCSAGCNLNLGPIGDGGAGGLGEPPTTNTGGQTGSGAGLPGDDVNPQTAICADCLPLVETCSLPDVTVESIHEVRRVFRSTRTYASAGYVNAALRQQILPDPSRVIIDDVVNDLSRVVTEPTTVVQFTGEFDPTDQRPLVKVESYAFSDTAVGATVAPTFAVVVDRTVRMAPVFALQEAVVASIAERAGSVIVTAIGGEPAEPEAYDPANVKALFAAPQANGDVLAAATKALDALDKANPAHLLVVVDGTSSLSGVAELAEKHGVSLDVLVLGQIDATGDAAFDAPSLMALQPSVTTIGIFAGEGEDPGALIEAELGARFDEYFGVARSEPNLTWVLPDYFEEVVSVADSEVPTLPLTIGFDRTVRRDASFLLNANFDVASLHQLCEGVEVIKTNFLDGTTAWATSVTTANGFITPSAEKPVIVAYFDAVSLYARALRVPAEAPAACAATDVLAAKCANGKLDSTVCTNVTTVRANLDFIAKAKDVGTCPAL